MAEGIANRASERGAATIEYGIVVSLIAVAGFLVAGALGVEILDAFDLAQFEFDFPGARRPDL